MRAYYCDSDNDLRQLGRSRVSSLTPWAELDKKCSLYPSGEFVIATVIYDLATEEEIPVSIDGEEDYELLWTWIRRGFVDVQHFMVAHESLFSDDDVTKKLKERFSSTGPSLLEKQVYGSRIYTGIWEWSLRNVRSTQPDVFSELVQLCRGERQDLSGSAREALYRAAILDAHGRIKGGQEVNRIVLRLAENS